MKKRTKISLRTKIYLTIVGLLALTGIIYAATPVTFSTFQGLTGVAVSKTEFFATGFIAPETNVYTLGCNGIPLVYQAAPGGEKYVDIAPAQAALAAPNPFTPRDVFVTLGDFIVKATPPGPFALFATVNCSGNVQDHTSITFDKVGTFGHNMIVTCQEGEVFLIDGMGNVLNSGLPIADGGDEIESPAVAPTPNGNCPGFGDFSGQILVADEGAGAVNS